MVDQLASPMSLTLPHTGTVEYVLSQCPAPTIAISGTSGKSVVRWVTAEALRESGFRVAFGLRPVLAEWRALGSRDRVLFEVPPTGGAAVRGVAVLALTGLEADELAPSQTWSAVHRGLQQAITGARHKVIIPYHSATLRAMVACARATIWRVATHKSDAQLTLVDGTIIARNGRGGEGVEICRLDGPTKISRALATDVLIAVATALAAGAEPQAIAAAVRHFAPPPDCQELLGIRSGVRWVCDARATRPGRTAAAMDAVSTPVLLIAGGTYGGQTLDRWAASVARARHVILFGPAGDPLAQALLRQSASHASLVRCYDLDDAFAAAGHLARPGDTVLFSPSCEPSPGTIVPPGERFRALVAQLEVLPCEAA